MFPVTNDSQTIIDCLTRETDKLGIIIKRGVSISSISRKENLFSLISGENEFIADKIIIASGGNPKAEGFNWLKKLGHTIVPPVPSLFTFNMPNETIKKLMGVVANPVSLKIKGTKLSSDGPLLITHWGMSGPAVLKLSSWGARELNAMNYKFEVLINWLGDKSEQELRDFLDSEIQTIGKRQIGNKNPFQLPNRLWLFLLEKNEIVPETPWNQLPKKSINKLLNTLVNDCYKAEGKTTFKEEFVTCGGVSLASDDKSCRAKGHLTCFAVFGLYIGSRCDGIVFIVIPGQVTNIAFGFSLRRLVINYQFPTAPGYAIINFSKGNIGGFNAGACEIK